MAGVSKVLVADDEAPIRGLLESVFRADDAYDLVAACADGQAAIDAAREHRPDVVLLDVRMPRCNGLSACRQIRELLPDAIIIMISALGDEDFVREATAAGARDYIVKPFKIDQLLETLRRELELSRRRTAALSVAPRAGHERSRTWAFWSPRAGAGVTSLAINAALEIARVNQKTLFFDLDLVFPDSPKLLGLSRDLDVSALVDPAGRLAAEKLDEQIETHTSGLFCLHQHNALAASKVRDEHVRQLLKAARRRFDYVVLDLPGDTGAKTAAALDAADVIWVVAGPDPLAAKNIARALGLFAALGYPDEKVRLLLNRVDRTDEALVRALLPREPDGVLPADPQGFQQAMRTAYPAVLSHPSSPYSRALKTLVAQSLSLTTESSVPPERSWSERLLDMIRG